MTKYQKIPEYIEAFQMTDETKVGFVAWPDWAIAARNKDPRQVGSIFLTNPEEPEGSFSIRTEYDAFEIPIDFWLILLASGHFMIMQDDLFQGKFIPAGEKTKASPKSETVAAEKKVQVSEAN